MSTLHLTRGLPGAGKTTWATAWVADDPDSRARLNRDGLRLAMYGAKVGLSRAQESAVTAVAGESVRALLAAGRDVVVDDMNLRPMYVRSWRKRCREWGHAMEVHEFPLTIEESIARQESRGLDAVPADAIRGMGKYLGKGGSLLPVDPPMADPEPRRYARTGALRAAWIVDLDGTLALHTDRSPYDFTRVDEDKPNTAVVHLVRCLDAVGRTIIYCSGRDDSCRDATEAWLWRHVGVPGPLLMRVTGDKRPDPEVKAEIFWRDIAPNHDVIGVLDDRDRVVKMWRSIGLTCLQVAPGNF